MTRTPPLTDSPLAGLTRRDVLRGLGGLMVAGSGALFDTRANAAGGYSLIPAGPNLAQTVSDVQAYAQKSVRAGDVVDFRVSSPVPYQLSVTRLGWDTEGTSRDWTLHAFPQAEGVQRSIRPGSYVHVERALPSATPQPQLSLECWVRPFRAGWQGLISQYDFPNQAGFGLFVDDLGRPAFYFGNGGAFNASFLRSGPSAIPILPNNSPTGTIRPWTHLCVVFNAGIARLYVGGLLVLTATGLPSAVTPGGAPLRLGAYGQDATTRNFLDGDLAMPAIYDRALDAVEISQRANPNAGPAVNSIGCWPLDEEGGYTIHDVGSDQREGIIVNRGTWMVGGPAFHAESVPRFGPYDPDDPDTNGNRGHALRLSGSDLFDCAWPISHSYTLSTDLLPGVYVGRILYGGSARYDVTFVVKRAPSRPAAPILVLCATNTWHAYNAPFGLYSFYQNHAGGQPGYYVGVDMPWSSADPYIQYVPAYNYSHLLRAERFTHVWLEQNGYAYDVVSDRDLHDDPGMLADYSAVLILGHSEYWSREAYTGVRDYLSSGGKVFVGSGNTMFWRVSFDDDVIECRKLPTSVGGRPGAAYGELYHEHDHLRGGLMREAGLPAWQAIGLECVGYDGPHVPYRVTNPTHTFFQSPESIPVSVGTELGGPYGVGHEWDVRVQSIPGPFNPPLPPDYNPVVLAEGRGSQNRLHYQADVVAGSNQILSEIIDWQWSGGGRVLSAGSIAAGAALHEDGKMAALLRNALHHFGVLHRVNALAIGLDGHFNHKWFDGSIWGPSFAGWEDMGGGFANHSPIGVMWAPDRISVMAISSTGNFLYRYWSGSAWSSWSLFGSGFTGRPAAVGWGRNRLQLLARGTNGELYEDAWNGTTWSGWTSLGSGAASDPSAIAWEGNQLAVATLGGFGQVLYKWYSGGVWNPTPTTWQDMGGTFARPPTLFGWGGKYVDLFAVDASGAVYNKHWNGTTWSPSLTGWDYLGGSLASRVVVGARGKNEFSLFGIGTDGRLKLKWWDGTAWGPSATGWQDLGGTLIGEPAVASYRGDTLSVLAVGTDNRAKHLLWDGSTWSAWQDMGGSLRGSPALLPWIGSPGSTTVPIDRDAAMTALGVGFVGLLIARQHTTRREPVD